MKKQERLHLINILKVFSMFSIITLHTNEFIFYTNTNPIVDQTFIYYWMSQFSRVIPFSGQTIVFCIFFLWGLTQKKFKSFFLFASALITIHLLMIIPFLDDYSLFITSIEWDIYPFIVCSYVIVKSLERIPINRKIYIITSILFLLIPTSFFTIFDIPWYLKGPLVGTCSAGGSGSWPLIPWAFLAILAYFYAQEVKKHSKITTGELLIWAPFLIAGATQFGKLYDVPIGPDFYCYILNLEISVFWGHFIYIIFLTRIAVTTRVQIFLSNLTFVNFLSNLAWSRKFGYCYVVQVIILIVASQFQEIFYKPLFLDIFIFSLFPVTEMIVSFLIKKRGK